jgi:hypothetical protein
LAASISASFFERRHALSCFSRWIAASIEWLGSTSTGREMPCLAV